MSYKTIILCILSLTMIAVASYIDSLILVTALLLSPIVIYFLLKSDKLLVISVVYVFVIDAGNGFFPIPLREGLFLILIFKLIYLIFFKGYRNIYFPIFLILSILIPVYGVSVSLFRGNNISYAIDDASGYIFFVTGLALASLVYYKPELKKIILKHFLISSVIVSAFTILLYFSYASGLFSFEQMRLLLTDWNIGFAGIEVNGAVRIFLRNHIYVLVSFIFIFGYLLLGNLNYRLGLYLLLVLFGSALIISNSRGLFVGLAIGMFLLFVIKKLSFLKIVIAYAGATLFLLSLFFFSEGWQKIWTRVSSIFDFENDTSNNIRREQSAHLLNEFTLYPIFGKGYGSTLTTGFVRDASIPYSFELSYLELLYKLGIIGFVAFVLTLSTLFLVIRRCEDELVKKISFVVLLTFFLISLTNPFIVSSLGMFLLSIIFAITQNNSISELELEGT